MRVKPNKRETNCIHLLKVPRGNSDTTVKAPPGPRELTAKQGTKSLEYPKANY